MCIDAYGVRIGIRAKDRDSLRLLVPYLPPGWKRASSPQVDVIYSFIGGDSSPGSRVKRFHILYQHSGRLERTLELQKVFDKFESDVQFQVAEKAKRRVFVHAGVVGWQGKAIVLPGKTHSGKSVLTAALVRAGATYYSDEFAIFDSQGRVHPFPRSLTIRQEKGGLRRYATKDLGGNTGVKPLPVGLIVFSKYQKGSRWRPRSRSPGQGMLELLLHTVQTRAKPKLALATLRNVVGAASILKSTRGEADEVAKLLLDIV